MWMVPNNDERMIFSCKGVETVRKLGWAPDIIHCQGWFASLVLTVVLKNFILKSYEPVFVKVITPVFDNGFDGDCHIEVW